MREKKYYILGSIGLLISLLAALAVNMNNAPSADKLLSPKSAVLYQLLEWPIKNPGFRLNNFDLTGTVTFVHETTGTKIQTGMFFDENDTWKFRFTPTLTGKWSFTSSSESSSLDSLQGTVLVSSNPNPQAHGFIKHFGNKWGWQGTEQAFIPQYVMGKNLSAYLRPDKSLNIPHINQDIAEFVDHHGFTGFHFPVQGNWFAGSNPDPALYRVLETFIQKVHRKGGSCHLWLWGSDAEKGSGGPKEVVGDAFNEMDKRNLRYLAARLGPLPGWSMGYGYDVENGWASNKDLNQWKSYLEKHLGWDHYIGARVGFDDKGLFAAHPPQPKPRVDQHNRSPVGEQYTSWLGGDYMGYTSYRPLFDRYVEVLKQNPDKPVFEEDRFRLRQFKKWNFKDYTEELTRRGLWHSAMAGGVANIWGNLLPTDDQNGSRPYAIKHLIKTYSRFFTNRFKKEMQSEKLGTALCLRTPDGNHQLYYSEGTREIKMNLEGLPSHLEIVAVDTKKLYQEIKINPLSLRNQIWQAPYPSDWAMAVGDFN